MMQRISVKDTPAGTAFGLVEQGAVLAVYPLWISSFLSFRPVHPIP
jgi:hypothetical protein